MKYFYTEKYKSLMKEIKENLKKRHTMVNNGKKEDLLLLKWQ